MTQNVRNQRLWLLGVASALMVMPIAHALAADCQTCDSCAEVAGGPYCIVVCPAGDGTPLGDVGATITVTITDGGVPAEGIPPQTFYVFGCNGGLVTCPGTGGVRADAPTDENGQTTISGAIKGGGYDSGLGVFTGIIPEPNICLGEICVPITVVSPDINGDLQINIVDVSLFAQAFPPQAGNPTADFDCSGTVNIADLAAFAQHLGHVCP